MTNGNIQVTYAGPPGQSYKLWAITNVTTVPAPSTWTLLLTSTMAPTGTASYTDTAARNIPVRLYSISSP